MPKREFSEAEKRYRAFDKRRSVLTRILSFLHHVNIVFIAIGFYGLKFSSYKLLLFSGCTFLLLILIDILVSRKLRTREKKLYVEAYGEDTEYERSGLFKEIWSQYEYDGFERIVDSRTKCKYIDDYKNTIDLHLVRRRHEFNIMIDETGVHFLADDETDFPIEYTVPLSDLKSLEDFYDCVRKFVLEHS